MALWPGLRKLMGDFTVPSFVQIRPVDLYVTQGYRQNGVVLVGDAFSTSCPAAGTGARKVLVDVERLCNVHIPHWLATPGMGDSENRRVLRRPGQAGLRRALRRARHSSCARFRSTRRCAGRRCAGQVRASQLGWARIRRGDAGP